MSWGSCKYCGERIVWAQMPGGNWLPMDPDFGERHQCGAGRSPQPTHHPSTPPTPPPQVWRWPHSHEKIHHPTNCPKCGEEVYFVRHNGGSVWLDELGDPWPKHPCFDDEQTAATLRAEMRLNRGVQSSTFGVITYASAEADGDHRYIIQCADGSTIDTIFESGWELPSLPGALVIVNSSDESIIIGKILTNEPPAFTISIRIQSSTPETTANWIQKSIPQTETTKESAINNFNTTIELSSPGLPILISSRQKNNTPIEIVINCETRKDLALYLANLEINSIPYEIHGSDDTNDLEATSQSADGLQITARANQPEQK